jgi:hypothetical protein
MCRTVAQERHAHWSPRPHRVAVALVLTPGVPRVASATVFFCGSGDVGCVIDSIESANAGPGPDTIILEAGM